MCCLSLVTGGANLKAGGVAVEERSAGRVVAEYFARPTLATLWVTFRDLAAHTPPEEPFRAALRIAHVVQATLLMVGRVARRATPADLASV
jgi:hypothetical protein